MKPLSNFSSITRLPASRSSSVGPEGRFLFCHPKVKGGGESFDKNENHGLEMHVKSFEVSLDFALFLLIPPLPLVLSKGEGVLSLDKNDHGLKMHFMSF